MTDIQVDFNNRDDAGLVFARATRADGPIHEGEVVRTVDDEGNQCVARVARTEGELVFLTLDMRTFVAAPSTTSWSTYAEVVGDVVSMDDDAATSTGSVNPIPVLVG